MIIHSQDLAPNDIEIRVLESNGWSLTIDEQVSRMGFSSNIFDSLIPHLVHLRGKPSIQAMLSARVRGLPVLLEHNTSMQQIYQRMLATVTVPVWTKQTRPIADLHYLYLATLNIAFGPATVRAKTRHDLSLLMG
jgi:hypothetical protein